MNNEARNIFVKVPAVTFGFWIIKVIATTLGETGGDTLSMTMDIGYLVSTAIFMTILCALVWFQIKAKAYNPWLYWATIIASTTAGTTLADFATRSMGIGYTGGSALLALCVAGSLMIWYRAMGSISVESVHEPKAELYYWITITFSQTLGTAIGDWTADTGGLGYSGAAIIFAAMLAVVALLYYRTAISRVWLFWAAFILTRPLGAAVGDFLDKPLEKGGLDFSRPLASGVLAVAIVGLIMLLPKRAAGQ
jgi:uncharacterized membrane-anchored protein